jgi:hypothetical protein
MGQTRLLSSGLATRAAVVGLLWYETWLLLVSQVCKRGGPMVVTGLSCGCFRIGYVVVLWWAWCPVVWGLSLCPGFPSL